MAIEDRRNRLRSTRTSLGIKGAALAAAAQKLADAAGAEIRISQQSISDFENNAGRKRIPAWLGYVERALQEEASRQGVSVAAPSEELSELAALMLAVISKPGSETKQPRALAKTLAGVAEGYFGRGPTRPTIKHSQAPKARVAHPATARSRGPNS